MNPIDTNGTRHNSAHKAIMSRPAFKEGFEDARNGRPFSPAYEKGDQLYQWTYERGRLFAVAAPQVHQKPAVSQFALAAYRAARKTGALL
jgi:hypothetical protein